VTYILQGANHGISDLLRAALTASLAADQAARGRKGTRSHDQQLQAVRHDQAASDAQERTIGRATGSHPQVRHAKSLFAAAVMLLVVSCRPGANSRRRNLLFLHTKQCLAPRLLCRYEPDDAIEADKVTAS